MAVASDVLSAVKEERKRFFEEAYRSFEQSIYYFVILITRNCEASIKIVTKVFEIIFLDPYSLYKKIGTRDYVFKLARMEALKNLQDHSIKRSDTCSMQINKRVFTFDFANTFPETENLILIFHVTYGFSFRDIAKTLNLPVNLVIDKYCNIVSKIRYLYKERCNNNTNCE